MANIKEIENILLTMYTEMGMDRPENHDSILKFVVEDVAETADPELWSDSDVAIAFRRWVEKVKSPENIYFVFGKEPCRVLEDKGIKGLIRYSRREGGVVLVHWNSETDSVLDLLSEFSGWDDYATLTEEEYNKVVVSDDLTLEEINENIWSEIRNDFEDEGIVNIDAWTSADDDESGTVIAKVNTATKEVEYVDERAKTDKYAQEMINEVLNDL